MEAWGIAKAYVIGMNGLFLSRLYLFMTCTGFVGHGILLYSLFID